jgi:uncharacterized LabA/DUF88 family protein
MRIRFSTFATVSGANTTIIEDQEFSSIRPLFDWLDYNGYTVVTKATKEFVDASGRRKVKGNTDIELAVHAMELAGRIDEMILFSGDGETARAVKVGVPNTGVERCVTLLMLRFPPSLLFLTS